MTPRDSCCFQCGSRFVIGASGELVEYTLTAARCRGCRRYLVILQASAHKRALMRAALDAEPPTPLTLAAIYARLTGGRVAPTFDAARAAANDRDDE